MSAIARGAAINLATRLLVMALWLCLTIVTARLGTREQGTFALFTAIESAIVMLGSGFGVAIARRISHHRENPDALVGAVMLACVVFGIAVAVVLWGVAHSPSAGYDFLAILAWGAPVMLLAPNLLGVWLGSGSMVAMARVTLAAPLLTLVGIGVTLALRGDIDLLSVLWSWVVARVVVAIGTSTAAWRSGRVARPRLDALAAEWRLVALIGLTNLIGLLNYKVDLFLVERLVGMSATGVYSIAVLVAELLWLVSSSVSQAAYSRIGDRDNAEASRITVRAVHSSLIALSLLGPLLWIAAAWLLPHLLGPEYAAALPALALLLPGVVAYGAASALSAYFTNHAGRPYIAAGLAGLSLISTVALSLVLIPRWGMLGAAVATTVSYLGAVGVSMRLFCNLSGVTARQLYRPDWQALRGDFGRLRSIVRRARV